MMIEIEAMHVLRVVIALVGVFVMGIAIAVIKDELGRAYPTWATVVIMSFLIVFGIFLILFASGVIVLV